MSDRHYSKEQRPGQSITKSLFLDIQNSLFSTQHIVQTTTFFFAYDVLKRERAEDRAYVGSFPTLI